MQSSFTFAAAALLALSAPTAEAMPSGEIGYEKCVTHRDPPHCLMKLAAPLLDKHRVDDRVIAIVTTGEIGLVMQYKSTWEKVITEKNELEPDIFQLFGGPGAYGAPFDYDPQVFAAAASAAIALAAAALTEQDPYQHPIVKNLIAKAKNDPAIERYALSVWHRANTYREWDGGKKLSRPKGMRAIFEHIVAFPQYETAALLGLSGHAWDQGYTEQGLALLRMVLARSDVTSEQKLRVSRQLAIFYNRLEEAQALLSSLKPLPQSRMLALAEVDIAIATLRVGYDKDAAQRLVLACTDPITNDECSPPQRPLWGSYWKPLSAANAKKELLALAELFYERATASSLRPEYRGQAFAQASETFRLADDRRRAVHVAKEGLQFVVPAVNERLLPKYRFPSTPQEKQRAAVMTSGFGSAPVISLYRAGEIEAALGFGYLTGLHRYESAIVAGEKPDVKWVVEDRDLSALWSLTDDFVRNEDTVGAEALIAALGNLPQAQFSSGNPGNLFALRGALVAMSGRSSDVDHEFTKGLWKDEPESSEDNRKAIAFFVANHAAHWKRARIIASRVRSRVTLH